MAISRPLLLVLVAAFGLLVATTALRVLGSGGESSAATQGISSSSPDGARPAAGPPAGEKARPPARKADAAKQARKAAKPSDPQAPVLRALAARRVVVLFFGQYRSADDQATRRAVRAIGRGRKDVAVFAASINDVADYARVVGALGIEQSPSTIVIDRKGQARVVQGFLDKGSLRQLVADARSS